MWISKSKHYTNCTSSSWAVRFGPEKDNSSFLYPRMEAGGLSPSREENNCKQGEIAPIALKEPGLNKHLSEEAEASAQDRIYHGFPATVNTPVSLDLDGVTVLEGGKEN